MTSLSAVVSPPGAALVDFLANATLMLDPMTPEPTRRRTEPRLLALLPMLQALGFFDLFTIRDPALAALGDDDETVALVVRRSAGGGASTVVARADGWVDVNVRVPVLGGVLLDGLTATTHWAVYDELAATGAVPVADRIVEHGTLLIGAGVSAGIDLALLLVARMTHENVARAIQLGIEYDPQPPFDAGSPQKAGEDIVSLVLSHGLD